MNFGDMQQEVVGWVKRPDKITQAKIAINAAIQFYTLAASFTADLVEGQLVSPAISTTLFAQSITISTNFPNFRKIKYLKPEGWTRYLKQWDPSRIFDDNGCEQTNVWYRSGDSIVFKVSDLITKLNYGYFENAPRLAQTDDTYWMLDTTPNMIRWHAVSLLMRQMGEIAEADKYLAMANADFNISRVDLEDAVTPA